MARNRLLALVGMAVLAVVIVALVVVLAGGGDDEEPAKRSAGSAPESVTVLEGIPQNGAVLGKADAPYTMVEFIDPQCPFCAEYSQNVLPTLLQRYVKTGRLRMELRPLHFLGPDSTTLAQTIAAAATHDRAWQFMGTVFENQGEENSGYATDAWISSRLKEAGLDADAVLAEAQQKENQKLLALARSEAKSAGIDSTPSFLAGRTGGKLEILPVDSLTPEAFTEPLDELTAQG
jgi:protein-disulfide isomerase